MSSSILLVFTIITWIFVAIENVQASHLKIREKRLTNSQSDVDNLFKHKVHILIVEKRDCTGTIISNKFVLTAASCIVEDKSNGIDVNDVIEVRAGLKNISNPLELYIVRLVDEVHIPEFYFYSPSDTEEDLTNNIWDIAVLKLNHRLGLETDPRIEALKLSSNFEQHKRSEENDIMFTGFGANKVAYNPNTDSYEIRGYPLYLQYSRAKVLAPSTCNLKKGYEDYKMCAKLLHKDNAAACSGDIGGALFDQNEIRIIGVLSYANTDCNGEKPGVYTKIFPHYDFILKAMTNITDPNARMASFVQFPNYRNYLNENPWKYHWIYPKKPSMFRNILTKLNKEML